MRKLRLKRWDFICSYWGILISGVLIYLISMAVYLARTESFIGDTLGSDAGNFPMLFTRYSIPVLVLVAF